MALDNDPTTPTLSTDDDFANAFAEFALPEEKKSNDPAPVLTEQEADAQRVADQNPVKKDEPAPTPEPNELDEAARAARETPPADPVKTEPPVDPTDKLAQAIERLAARQPAPQQQQQQQAPAPEYTAEEQAVIQAYHEQFPEIARAEQLQRRSEYKQVVNYIFQQIQPALAQVAQQVAQVSSRTHMEDIYTLVPDYDDVREATIKWVEKQPDYLRAAFDQVVRAGNTQQVADLISRYKSDPTSGYKAPTPAPADGTATASAPDQQSARVAAAAKKLAPVAAKRSSVATEGISPNDFDKAFESFSAMMQ